MKQANLIKQTPTISQPDKDPFEYLVEHIDLPNNEEEADTVRKLEINSLPES